MRSVLFAVIIEHRIAKTMPSAKYEIYVKNQSHVRLGVFVFFVLHLFQFVRIRRGR